MCSLCLCTSLCKHKKRNSHVKPGGNKTTGLPAVCKQFIRGLQPVHDRDQMRSSFFKSRQVHRHLFDSANAFLPKFRDVSKCMKMFMPLKFEISKITFIQTYDASDANYGRHVFIREIGIGTRSHFFQSRLRTQAFIPFP